MTESDFVILNKVGGDLKIQLRIKTISCWLSEISVKCLGVKIHANIVLVTPCKLMISLLNWIEAVILTLLKRKKCVISWYIYHCHIYSGHYGIKPPSKTPSLSFLPNPLKSTNCPSMPILRNPLYILVFQDPPLKVGSFSESQKY